MKKKLWLATALLLALLLLVCACNDGTTDGGTTDGGTTDGGTHTHTPGEWLVDQAPTCMKPGTRHRECTVCGKTLSTETLPVDPSAHKLTATADDTYLYATCTENGCTATSETAHNMTFSVSGGKATLNGYEGSAASVVIPTTYNGSPVTSIGEDAFGGCDSLTSITIPSSVTSIGDEAFCSCDRLTSITIPNSVTSIGDWAFSCCSKLTSITIPNSVTSIGDRAFSGCDSLSSITVDKNNTVYHSAGNCLIETKTKTLIAGCKSSVIPSDGSVTSIGSSAFRGCSKLTSITIPNSVTSIGSSAFYDCYSLTSITIGNSVTSIGSYAFYYCTSLTNITIPNSVTSIGERAFYDCDSLTYNEYGNAYYLGNADNPYLYLAKAKSKDVTSCTIHANTRFIGSSAFEYCSSLTSITIPNSVTSIGDYAFSHCSSLTSITILNSVTSIGSYAFHECDSLTSITIPNSVTSIGFYAFLWCDSLTSIHFNGTKAQWNAISKGSYWNYATGAYTIYCTDGTLSK